MFEKQHLSKRSFRYSLNKFFTIYMYRISLFLIRIQRLFGACRRKVFNSSKEEEIK